MSNLKIGDIIVHKHTGERFKVVSYIDKMWMIQSLNPDLTEDD